jgi:hypothetical protein
MDRPGWGWAGSDLSDCRFQSALKQIVPLAAGSSPTASGQGRGCRDNNQSQRAKAGRLFTLRPPALEPRSRGCGHPERDLELSGSSACKRRQPCKPHSPHAGGRADFARHGAITHAITGQFLVKECRGEYVARQALTWARLAASFQDRRGRRVAK